jgi:hypothetical protein
VTRDPRLAPQEYPMSFRYAVLAALLLGATPAAASVAFPASVEDLARGSDAVVRGRVARTSARWVGKRIYTFAEIEVAAVWRGQATARVTVLTPGGVVGGLAQRVDGAALFDEGEEVVAFLSRAEAGTFRVAGLAQGKFAVRDGTATPDLAHTVLVDAPLRPGERWSEEMPVAELERRVRSAR